MNQTTPEGSTARRDSGLSILKDNLEAIAIAIVMALVIRHFCVEAFQIPTRSMEPTLFGQQDHDEGDRILVDKSAYLFSSPERWDVIVFKYPLDRSRNFIKRLIGLPGETVRIGNDGGDIWVRKQGAEEFEIARKPRDVREALYTRVYPPDPDSIPRLPDRAEPDFGQGGDGYWAYWRSDERGRDGWDLDDETRLRFTGGASASLRSRNPITTSSTPRSWQHSMNSATRARDVRVAGTITLRAGPEVADANATPAVLEATTVEVHWRPDERFEYGIRLASSEAGTSEAWVKREGLDVGRRTLPVQLTAGARVAFEMESVDGDLRVHLEGNEVLVLPDERRIDDESSSNTQELAFVGRGAGFDLTDVRIDRDLVYGNSWSYMDSATEGVTIPDDRFFMLGDNTGSSSDSRKWQIRTVTLKDGTEIKYDAQPGDNNPMRETQDGKHTRISIRDIWGVKRSWLDDDEVGGRPIKYAPFVSRDLIVGRAFLIFWPFFPDFPGRLRFIH